MNILSLISNSTGNSYKKKASTNGGEYSGSCPWCSGEDRFSIHPANNHYVCRQCKKAGDSISFLMDYEHKSYPQACVLLDMPFERKKPRYSSSLNSVNGSAWKPRSNASPDLVWHQKAASYLFQCFKFLMSAQPEAKEHRKWLNERGVSNDLIKKARLGWNAQSMSFSRESWGLAVDENELDKLPAAYNRHKIWIPAGLLIPYFENEKLIRLRIRQENPESTNRFILVAGSSMNYLNHSSADLSRASQLKEHLLKPESADIEKNKTVMVVESELDGWLIHDYAQQAGILLTVLSIGNVSARPEQSAHEIIANADKVFLCLDNDPPGDTETVWWKQQYPHVIDARMPAEYGKDPGDAFKAGLDIKSWLVDCVKSKNSNRESFFSAVASQIKEQPLQEHSPIPDPAALTKKTEQQVKPEYASKTCIHGYFCSSAKDNICLKTDEYFFDMQECPQKQWYVHEDGPVKLIIFGFGFKKMRRA
ncbi:MAG: CHC2 zinc finger domain-containing protein [Desulfamplus sp.]